MLKEQGTSNQKVPCRWRERVDNTVAGRTYFSFSDYYRWCDEFEAQAAEIERLTRERDEGWANALHMQVKVAEAELDVKFYQRDCDRLRAALSEAVGIVEHWGGYASKYFQDKHDLAGDIAKLVAAAGPADEPTNAP
jgi:hypothetical protein